MFDCLWRKLMVNISKFHSSFSVIIIMIPQLLESIYVYKSPLYSPTILYIALIVSNLQLFFANHPSYYWSISVSFVSSKSPLYVFVRRLLSFKRPIKTEQLLLADVIFSVISVILVLPPTILIGIISLLLIPNITIPIIVWVTFNLLADFFRFCRSMYCDTF